MVRAVTIGRTVPASHEFGVTRISSTGGDRHVTRNTPCQQCPWRIDVPVGTFPARAFEISAHTAYDAAFETFACHMAGAEHPATCAGFLLRHSTHNLGVRMAQMAGRMDLSKLSDGGTPVYRTYREMAEANGVDPNHPTLEPIRGNGD